MTLVRALPNIVARAVVGGQIGLVFPTLVTDTKVEVQTQILRNRQGVTVLHATAETELRLLISFAA